MSGLLDTDATVIFTSHDADIVNLAERVLVITDGRLVESTPLNKKNSNA